jgi:hypothetical protein
MSEPARAKGNNVWLIAFRKYHTWLGLTAVCFIVIIALSGIYLNHKDFFKSLGSFSPSASEPKKEKSLSFRGEEAGLLRTTTDLAALPVTFDQALAITRERWGEQPVERIELKNEKGHLIYKVKTPQGELMIDAGTGESAVHGGKQEKGKKAVANGSPSGQSSMVPRVWTAEEYQKSQKGGIDWGKLIKDLHTGKVGGLAGKLLVDLTALILIVLCLTGVYLYVVPQLRKRRSARLRALAAAEAARGHEAGGSTADGPGSSALGTP